MKKGIIGYIIFAVILIMVFATMKLIVQTQPLRYGSKLVDKLTFIRIITFDKIVNSHHDGLGKFIDEHDTNGIYEFIYYEGRFYSNDIKSMNKILQREAFVVNNKDEFINLIKDVFFIRYGYDERYQKIIVNKHDVDNIDMCKHNAEPCCAALRPANIERDGKDYIADITLFDDSVYLYIIEFNQSNHHFQITEKEMLCKTQKDTKKY